MVAKVLHAKVMGSEFEVRQETVRFIGKEYVLHLFQHVPGKKIITK